MNYRYDIDINSNQKETFLAIRDIILSLDNIVEKKREHITSYFSTLGGIFYLRTKGDVVILVIFCGAKLQDKYPSLQGNQKVLRHLYYKSIKDIDKNLIVDIYHDSIEILIDKHEMNKMKKYILK
jgi:hypothetical protein